MANKRLGAFPTVMATLPREPGRSRTREDDQSDEDQGGSDEGVTE